VKAANSITLPLMICTGLTAASAIGFNPTLAGYWEKPSRSCGRTAKGRNPLLRDYGYTWRITIPRNVRCQRWPRVPKLTDALNGRETPARITVRKGRRVG